MIELKRLVQCLEVMCCKLALYKLNSIELKTFVAHLNCKIAGLVTCFFLFLGMECDQTILKHEYLDLL